jgi:serine/threonine protein kinase
MSEISLEEHITVQRSDLILPDADLLTKSTIVDVKSMESWDFVTMYQCGFNRYGSGMMTKPYAYEFHGSGRTFLVRKVNKGDPMPDPEATPHAQYVTKSLRVSQNRSTEELKVLYRAFIQEVLVLRHPPLATHPNLPRVLTTAWETDSSEVSFPQPVIITHLADHGTLLNLLESYPLTYSIKRRLLLDVAEALNALHRCSIVHGDIKLENVLIYSCSDPKYYFLAKLSDFGFSLLNTAQDCPLRLPG